MFDSFQSNTTIYLREAVRCIRACKSSAEERAYVVSEIASIRNIFREERSDLRAIAMIKLLYFFMLGYPAHIGQMECLKLISSPRFSDKRVGYLGSMMLLDELADVQVLMTNSLKNDLEHSDRFVNSLALCTLASVCSNEMAQALWKNIESMCNHKDNYIRKKAILCVIRILRKAPELHDVYLPVLDNLATDRDPSIQLTTLSLAIFMCEKFPSAVSYLKERDVIAYVKKILSQLISKGASAEHCVHGIANPFLQTKGLRLLRHLAVNDKKATEFITDILTQVITCTQSKQIVGFSIIYEAVLTIIGIEARKELLILAVNSIGSFLNSSIRNAKFIGLSTLLEISKTNPDLVMRHRTVIRNCIVDFDDSIKKRAIQLIFTLLSKEDARTTIEFVTQHMKSFSIDVKRFTISLLINAIEIYGVSQKWSMEQFLLLIEYSSELVSEDVLSRVVSMISSSTDEIKREVVYHLYQLLCYFPKESSLVQIAAWTIGEYGHFLYRDNGEYIKLSVLEIVEVLKRLFYQPQMNNMSYYYILNALIKFATKCPEAESLHKVIKELQNNMDMEIQERAIEFIRISSIDLEMKNKIYSEMPLLKLELPEQVVETPSIVELFNRIPIENDKLEIYLEVPKKACEEGVDLNIIVKNKTGGVYSNFLIKVATTKAFLIKLHQPNTNALQNYDDIVQQKCNITSKEGIFNQRLLKLKIKVNYTFNGELYDKLYNIERIY